MRFSLRRSPIKIFPSNRKRPTKLDLAATAQNGTNKCNSIGIYIEMFKGWIKKGQVNEG
jgi:hypothetical protein